MANGRIGHGNTSDFRVMFGTRRSHRRISFMDLRLPGVKLGVKWLSVQSSGLCKNSYNISDLAE
jgi:hypothetical protein